MAKKKTTAKKDEAPKRKRGRPKKSETAAGAAPKKRGPGRPRKTETASAATAPKKRGPGRPRKHPAPDPNAPKRKRGRPRKTETTGQSAATPAKRGPGRPRKSETTAAEAPKRKRGRPRKSETPVQSPARPKKRGPGRPRKSESPVEILILPEKKRGPGRPRKHPLPEEGPPDRLRSSTDIARVRVRELSEALVSELDELEGSLPRVFTELHGVFSDRIARLRDTIDERAYGAEEISQTSALRFSTMIEKIAMKLADIQLTGSDALVDLSRLARRLDKARRRIRKLDRK